MKYGNVQKTMKTLKLKYKGNFMTAKEVQAAMHLMKSLVYDLKKDGYLVPVKPKGYPNQMHFHIQNVAEQMKAREYAGLVRGSSINLSAVIAHYGGLEGAIEALVIHDGGELDT